MVYLTSELEKYNTEQERLDKETTTSTMNKYNSEQLKEDIATARQRVKILNYGITLIYFVVENLMFGCE